MSASTSILLLGPNVRKWAWK